MGRSRRRAINLCAIFIILTADSIADEAATIGDEENGSVTRAKKVLRASIKENQVKIHESSIKLAHLTDVGESGGKSGLKNATVVDLGASAFAGLGPSSFKTGAAMNLGNSKASWNDDYCQTVLGWDPKSTSSSTYGSESWCKALAAAHITGDKMVTQQVEHAGGQNWCGGTRRLGMISVGIKRPSARSDPHFVCFCKESWGSIDTRWTCAQHQKHECAGKPDSWSSAARDYLPIGEHYCPTSGTGEGSSKTRIAGCMFHATWYPDCSAAPPFAWAV